MTGSENGKRGKLKIFLGAVAGVGKTFKMLSESHRRVQRGEDIVIGLVETHGRRGTAEIAEGIEQVPLKRIEYRGSSFFELDTAAVISRNPEWVLIDELAHTNIPGAVHEKRWQSVEEILDAGINVITTLNVQHIESLNDVVQDITGVQVRETVPDFVVDSADEIELVDLTPDALINRLKRGDIYRNEKIEQALQNFFRKENIVALRELALRRTADEVDEQLHSYLDSGRSQRQTVVHDYVVVCLTPRSNAAKLVRRGYRIAHRMQAHCDCLFVRTPGAMLTKSEEAAIAETRMLANDLGVEFIEREGDSIASEIIRYVKETECTFLVMGQSARSRLSEIFRGSLINRIMRETRGVDIVVVADCEAKEE